MLRDNILIKLESCGFTVLRVYYESITFPS